MSALSVLYKNNSAYLLFSIFFPLIHIFSSTEQEVLMVSYCDQSVHCPCVVDFCFCLLQKNCWTDFEIISQEDSLGDPLPKLLKMLRSVEQDGKIRKTFKQLLLNQWMDFEIIIRASSLGDLLPKLLKLFRSFEQNGCQGYK